MTLQPKNYSQKTNQNGTKNGKQYYMMMNTKNILNIPTLTFSFNNKQDLRSIITDYVLHNIQQEGKCIPSKKFKSKYIKYPNITLRVNINKQERQISLQFVTFLSKYIQFQKKNIYKQDRIQPLVVDILNFLDQIDQKTKGIIFQVDNTANQKKVEEEVMTLIIEKHHKDKQKKCYNVQIDEYKKKVIAKHTKVSYIDIQDQLKKKQKQFLLQISEVDNLLNSQQYKRSTKIIIPVMESSISDELSNLIENGQIFEDPTKIQKLKKQKMMQFYQSNQAQYQGYRTLIANDLEFRQNMGIDLDIIRNKATKNNNEESNNSKTSSSKSQDIGKMLKDWIIDIGISEKYYQQKFGKYDKRKTNPADKLQSFIQQPALY